MMLCRTCGLYAYIINPGIIVIFKSFLRHGFVGNQRYGQTDVMKIIFFAPLLAPSVSETAVNESYNKLVTTN